MPPHACPVSSARSSPMPVLALSTCPSALVAVLRATLTAVAALLLLVLAGPAALAHTGLESSDPAAGSVSVAPLEAVELTFNAPVQLLEESVVAAASDGRRIAATEVRDDEGLVVVATFTEPLGDGDWTVRWRVLATDSHPRTGEVPIEVEDAAASATPGLAPSEGPAASDGESRRDSTPASPRVEEPPPETSAETPTAALERAGDVARVLFYAGLLVAAGLALFKAGPHAGMTARARRLAGLALLGALIGLVAGTAEVGFHVAAVSGRGIAGVLDLGTWQAVLGTGLGPALLLRTVGLAMLAAGARRRIREGLASGPDTWKLLGALVAIASFQFVGHTASAAPPVIVRTADLVHAIAAAVWIGGLVGLGVTARTADPGDRAVTVARFSTWATGAVAGVTVAGVALAWVNLPTLAASWQTGYGRLLLAKLVLVGVLLLMGAHNHFNVVPHVVEGDDGAADELRGVVRWELAVVGLVVVLTALLVNATPL